MHYSFFVPSGCFVLYKKLKWAAKFSLGIINLFISIGFFAWYGTEPIQKFFAFQMFLLVLYLAYPFVSILLGNSFPQMVTYIMPCPVISISMTVYAGYKRKNKLLLALLTIWDFIFLSFPTPPKAGKCQTKDVSCFPFRGAILRFFKNAEYN